MNSILILVCEVSKSWDVSVFDRGLLVSRDFGTVETFQSVILQIFVRSVYQKSSMFSKKYFCFNSELNNWVQPSICMLDKIISRILIIGFIFSYPRESFIDPSTNNTFIKGQHVKRTRLAISLEVIAKEGGDALYNGSLVNRFIEDIVKHDGNLTVEDMKNYE